MTPCPLCIARGKTWPGDDPKCAFPDGADFTPSNWACATMDKLRGIVEDSAVYSDDHYVGVIPVSDVDDEDGCATHIVLHWYKHRGCTQLALAIEHDGGFCQLTLKLAEAIIRAHSGKASS